MNDEFTINSPERRMGGFDNSAVLSAIHQLETRVAVLETRAGAQDDRLLSIESEIKGIKTDVQAVLECLQAHMVAEENNRVKLLEWVIATLLSVIGFGIVSVINYFLI